MDMSRAVIHIVHSPPIHKLQRSLNDIAQTLWYGPRPAKIYPNPQFVGGSMTCINLIMDRLTASDLFKDTDLWMG